jgi:DNA polymerase sigma
MNETEDDDDFLAFNTSKTEDSTLLNSSIDLHVSSNADDTDGGKKEKDENEQLLNQVTVPWINMDIYRNNYMERKAPPLVRFHNEILTFCKFITPSKSELAIRERVISEIRSHITTFWPTCTVNIFGSHLTSILIPTSDIDIAVLNVPMKETETPVDLVNSLFVYLKEKVKIHYIEAVVNARIPIVKYDHSESGLSVDICINHDSGLRTGEYMNKMMTVYPPLRPLTLILKIFLVSISFLLVFVEFTIFSPTVSKTI